MKIYVGYTDHGYDGCSPPDFATTSLSEIEQWVIDNSSNWFNANYVEFEVDEVCKMV